MVDGPPSTFQGHQVIADRYEVVSRIAEGGMGSVYLARQIELDREVAIKTLRIDLVASPDALGRFLREAKAVQRLTHPNTVRVYDFGRTADGTPYMVMEYLRGQTLDAVIAQTGPLPVSSVEAVAKQVLKSLVEAHAHGIVHRDIKPSNLMLCHQLGEVNLVKVLDFGLARIDTEVNPVETKVGMTMGTPSYMSPEQVRSQPPDARSDLYSLGLTLYELVVGERAYQGAGTFQVAMQHLSPDSLRIPKPLAHSRLGRVIARASQKDPAERYQSAEEMLEELTFDAQLESGHEIVLLDRIDLSGPWWESAPSGQDGNGRLETTLDNPAVLEARITRTRRVALAWVVALALGVAALFSTSQSDDSVNAPSTPRSTVATIDQTGHRPSTSGPEERPSFDLGDAFARSQMWLQGAVHSASASTVPGEPASVVLIVGTEPAGAHVFVDDVRRCATPCRTQLERRDGLGTLRLVLDGYITVERPIDLNTDAVVPVTSLEPDPRADVARTDRAGRAAPDRRVQISRASDAEGVDLRGLQQERPPALVIETRGAPGLTDGPRRVPIDF